MHTQTWHMHTDTAHAPTRVHTPAHTAGYEDNVTLNPHHSSALNSLWDLVSYCLSGLPTIIKLPVELGIMKAKGFSHVSVSLKLYLWVSCAALTSLQWLQFYPENFYINIGLAQGLFSDLCLLFFYIFLQSSHSFSSLIMTLLCINWTKVRGLMHKRPLCLHVSPASPNRHTLLTMPSCLAKRLPRFQGSLLLACLSTESCLPPLTFAGLTSGPSHPRLPCPCLLDYGKHLDIGLN